MACICKVNCKKDCIPVDYSVGFYKQKVELISLHVIVRCELS